MQSIAELLQTARTIAVVGISDKLDRDSFRVAQYLRRAGYRIVPINPRLQQWQGIPAYADLDAVPAKITIDVVDVFRRADEVGPVVDAAIARGVGALWLQLGVVNEQVAARARQAGLFVVMDRCIMVEHQQLSR